MIVKLFFINIVLIQLVFAANAIFKLNLHKSKFNKILDCWGVLTFVSILAFVAHVIYFNWR